MSRLPQIAPAERLELLAIMMESGAFNQVRYARRVRASRDTARRDLRKFLDAHPWAYRYSFKTKVFEKVEK